jgi:hypothetical protein
MNIPGLLWLLFYCPKNIQDFLFKKPPDVQVKYISVKTTDSDDNYGFEMV